MDSGDKGTNKCHSVAHKYALLTLLMIPTEDMAEPDAHTPEPATFKKQPEPAFEPEPAPTLPADLLKSLESYGYAFYGNEWAENKPKLAQWISGKAVSDIALLSEQQAQILLKKIQKKLDESGLSLLGATPNENLPF
jgi:hypothetical protein